MGALPYGISKKNKPNQRRPEENKKGVLDLYESAMERMDTTTIRNQYGIGI